MSFFALQILQIERDSFSALKLLFAARWDEKGLNVSLDPLVINKTISPLMYSLLING